MKSVVEKIKVWFRFVPREGWFPQDTEGLWATKLSDDTARVENAHSFKTEWPRATW